MDISVSVGVLECGSGESGGDGTGGCSGSGGGGLGVGFNLGGGSLVGRVVGASGSGTFTMGDCGWGGIGGGNTESPPNRSVGDSEDDIEKHFRKSFKLKEMDDIPLK